MNSFTTWLHGALTWAHAALTWAHGPALWLAGQAKATASILAAVASDNPEPARQVLAYLTVTAALTWLALRAIRKKAGS